MKEEELLNSDNVRSEEEVLLVQTGRRLKKLRLSRNLSMELIANDLKIPESTIASWELGRTFPKLPRLIALANYYNVSLDFLMSRTEDPRPISSLWQLDEANKLISVATLSEGQQQLMFKLVKELRDIKKFE